MSREQELEQALYDMVIAYVNKDEEFAHSFEITALENAKNLLANKHNKSVVKDIYEETIQKAIFKGTELDYFIKTAIIQSEE